MPAETSWGECQHRVVSNREVIPAIAELWLAPTMPTLPYHGRQFAHRRGQGAKDMPDRASDDHACPGAIASTMQPARIGQVTVPAQPSGRR
ncbi:hypothetical protein BN971_04491 [Mycobacterium bohemicum DSM 44277]|uniref:Uncharacterized protein n=2 Tax=Mycobacterium bohemicum TaxID=56425 RepID=A0A1X1R5Q1_MYCBE|nr:hypothetical protein AWB93_09575 [Mycobacterium bohemicum]CPR13184.1 hypothetical protein BN971_04491 [Mycobacterium bohemicum DSM 44277]